MAKPIYLYNRVSLGANSRGTLVLQGGEGETITLNKIFFNSTGSFVVLRMRTSGGSDYISDQNGNGIQSQFFTPNVSPSEGVNTFTVSIDIAPAELLYVEVQDTSGSNNTVSVLFVGERE